MPEACHLADSLAHAVSSAWQWGQVRLQSEIREVPDGLRTLPEAVRSLGKEFPAGGMMRAMAVGGATS